MGFVARSREKLYARSHLPRSHRCLRRVPYRRSTTAMAGADCLSAKSLWLVTILPAFRQRKLEAESPSGKIFPECESVFGRPRCHKSVTSNTRSDSAETLLRIRRQVDQSPSAS